MKENPQRKTQRRSQKHKRGGNEVNISTICDELNYLNQLKSTQLDYVQSKIVENYLEKIDDTLKNNQSIAKSQVICMVDFVYNYSQKEKKKIKNVEALLDLLIANRGVDASSKLSDKDFQTHVHEFEKLHFALEEYLVLKKKDAHNFGMFKNKKKITYYFGINDMIQQKMAAIGKNNLAVVVGPPPMAKPKVPIRKTPYPMPKMSMKKTFKVLQKAVPKDLPKMSFKKTFKVLQKVVPKAVPKAVPKSVPKAVPKAVPKTTKKRKLPGFFKMKRWKRATPKNRPNTPAMVKMHNSPVELSFQTIYSKSETIPFVKIHKSKSHTRKEYMKNQYKKSLKQPKKQPKKSLESVRLIV
jgi:hypothetical protein